MISLSKRKLGRDLQKLAEVKHLQKLALKKKHHLVDGGHQLHFCPKLNFCLKLSEELKIEVGPSKPAFSLSGQSGSLSVSSISSL